MRAAAARVVTGVLLACLPGAGSARGQAAPGPAERIAEVRVHGNYATPDAEVLRLAAVTVGDPFTASTLAEIRGRLQTSGRFDDVEVRKRFRSIADPTEIVVVIVVTEFPTPDVAPPGPPNPVARIVRNGMFLPVLGYADGYGFTYGGRVTFAGVPAGGGRVSVPLTWGGTKRAAVEVEQRVPRGPIDRMYGGAAISRRRNPHDRVDDDRRLAWVGASRTFASTFALEGRAAVTRVGFAGIEERFTSLGARVTLDTRVDPAFPRNALLASAGWERLTWDGGRRVNRYRTEVRGFIGLLGPAVLSIGGEMGRADRPLPRYERFLLGGAGTLRGHRAGSFSGDNLAAASAEIRIPFTSPLDVGRMGVNLFVDGGTAFDHGTRLRDARWRWGGGAGLFLQATILQINLDVAFREGGGARVHVMSGFQF